MKSDIRVCGDWKAAHKRPVYTLGGACPECGAAAVNSAPAPFNPEDPYGEYRRRARMRNDAATECADAADSDTVDGTAGDATEPDE